MDSAMTQTLAITIYDRTPEVIRAVCAGLSLPGNLPDVVCVCYDRAPRDSIYALRKESKRLGFELRETVLNDGAVGPRCPSKAWNMALSLVADDNAHVFCMSSEMVLAPHSIGMAYHLSEACPEVLIVGRAEHCGQSYAYTHEKEEPSRTITAARCPSPLGFSWLLPMKTTRKIGGFDETYMNGLCYEDSDFTVRLWNAGADFVFCDDIMGFHLEHKRDHLVDADGRVTINEKIFTKQHGDVNYLRDKLFKPHAFSCDIGLSFWLHDSESRITERVFIQQKLYGQYEPWRAFPVTSIPKVAE